MWLDDHRTALYRFYDKGGALLYVGITANLDERFAHHERFKPWWPQVAKKRVEWFDSRPPALVAELAAIKAERPLYNVIGTPGAYKRRDLAPNEVASGVLRAQLSEYVARVQHGDEEAVIVDGTRQRKRVAVLVGMDFYERALAAMGEQRELVAPADS